MNVIDQSWARQNEWRALGSGQLSPFVMWPLINIIMMFPSLMLPLKIIYFVGQTFVLNDIYFIEFALKNLGDLNGHLRRSRPIV